ncbi:MAG: MBL fold metallo-hydrolase, partial [Gemmatimonadota bacterium]
GTSSNGATLDAEARSDVRYSLRLRRAHPEELRGLELIGPTRTFDRRLELDTGKRTVRLLHFGPAHTRGDVVVHLPEAGVLAVGDLLEHGEPWTEGADVAGWGVALDSIAALDASIYLPGHGPAVRDRTLLEEHCALFDAATCTASHGDGVGR